PKTLERAAEAVKYDGIKDITLDNVNLSFEFHDGRITVEPVDFVIGKEIPAKFSGSHGFDGTLDYVMNLDIPSKLMGGAATQVVSGMLAKATAATGVNMQMPERVKVDLDIAGTTDDPKIPPRIAGTEGGTTKDDLKNQALDEL